MLTKLEELKNIRTGLFASSLALVFKNSQARDGEAKNWFELGGLELEGSTKQSIELLTHKFLLFFR